MKRKVPKVTPAQVAFHKGTSNGGVFTVEALGKRKHTSILSLCGTLKAPPGVHVGVEQMNAWPPKLRLGLRAARCAS